MKKTTTRYVGATGVQTSHRVPEKRRLVHHQSVPLQRLLLHNVGVSAVLQESRVDKTASVAFRIGRDLRRVPSIQSARKDRPEVLRYQVRLQ